MKIIFNAYMKVASILIFLITASCVDIKGPNVGNVPPEDLLATARLKSSAVMITKGDSHKLQLDLISMSGDTIPLEPENAVWTSSDARVVSVNTNGTIYGVAISASAIRVIVSYNHGYVTKLDTVSVYVTADRIDANQIKLISLDSNRTGGLGAFGMPRVRVDLYKNDTLVQKGSLIPIQVDAPATAVVALTDGPNGEPVYRIKNDKLKLGKLWVRGSLNLYGNEVNDSIEFTGLGDDMIPLSIYEFPDPDIETLLDTVIVREYQVCGVLMILNYSQTYNVDILFSDSTSAEPPCDVGDGAGAYGSFYEMSGYTNMGVFTSGNIVNLAPSSFAVRKTRTSGVITYTTRRSGTNQIIPFLKGHYKQFDVEP